MRFAFAAYATQGRFDGGCVTKSVIGGPGSAVGDEAGRAGAETLPAI
jgi:hypothetical protein